MRHLSLIATTILMALAVVSSAALGLWPAAAPAKNEEMAIKQEGQKQESALLFNEVSSKKGSTKDGAPFSSQLYQSSDGIEVTVTRENRDSAGRANKELQKKLKGSLRIIGRAPKLDEKRERVGERVVAIFAFDDSQKEQASVLWTNGQQFYYIESLSLKHALEFEKQFYR